MALQLSAIKTSFQNYKQDISDVSTALYVDWINYIAGYLYENLLSETPDKFLKTYTVTVASGTQNYTLPTDFLSLRGDGCGLYPVDSTGQAYDQPLSYTGYASSVNGYYIADNDLVITPNPTQSVTYILRYAPQPPTFTTDLTAYFTFDKTQTGTLFFPDHFKEYLIRALDVQYGSWDEDAGAESYADARFVRVMSELFEKIRQTPRVYTHDSSMSAF